MRDVMQPIVGKTHNVRTKILFRLASACVVFDLFMLGDAFIFAHPTWNIMVPLTLALIVFSVAIVWLMLRWFTSFLVTPLIAATTIMRRAAEGDLTAIDPHIKNQQSSFEMHALTLAISSMIDNTRSLVGQMTSLSQQLSTTTNSYKDITNSATASAHQVAQAINQVASGAQTQSVQLSETSNTMETVTAYSTALAHEAQAMRSAMEQVQTTVTESGTQIRRLGDRSEKIGNIIATINELADQTNLLALNAAIEAARAGEYGRGFAVVADEVRKLAQRSTTATREIEQIIGETQRESTDAVAAMKVVERGILESTGRVVQTGMQAELMQNETAQAQKAITSAASISEEHSMVAGEVSNATQSMVMQMSEMLALIQGFSEISGELHHTARKFHWTYLDALSPGSQTAAKTASLTSGQHILAAIQAHIAWKAKIRDFLKGSLKLDADTVADPTLCAFGKWLYGGAENVMSTSELVEIKAHHKTFHEVVANIVRLHEQHRESEVAEAMKIGGAFQTMSETLVNRLLELQKRVGNQQRAA